MPSKPKKPCAHPGCPELVTDGHFCTQHQQQDRKQYDKKRGSAAARGYDARWKKYRIQYLRDNPLCVECLANGKVVPASVVDHKQPHKGDPILFWAPWNHQPLCKQCHDRKTASQDGGFGNKYKIQ